ncbi:MAG TPA: TauD/TfdA family dioxygenase [Acidimicrobiia bacterium]|nr:TauD/TfdA family dioxygenase [Acidimicrobiia bacterium]
MSDMKVTKLSDAVGAEVTGVDVDRLLSDDALPPAIMDALEQHGVLVFRELHLDPERQVAFCRRLGEVDLSPGHHPVPGIYRVTLDTSKNANADYLRGTFVWHIDGCTPLDDEPPQKATMLTAQAVADDGGDTEFASTYRAYDDLSDEERDRFAPMRVVHTLESSQRLVTPDPTPDEVARWRRRPRHEHPLVWKHRTGRRSLVLGASTSHVVGMDRDDGRKLLDDLLDRATVPERVYRHEWTVGDTVIWDNRGVLHRAVPYEPTSPREMLRTTLLGDEPIQ